MAASDARPIPRKNAAYRVTLAILDADGDLVTGATGLDSEISKDGGTFADCTNEATEIATSSGMYYLDLTSTEMNADTVAIIVKTSTSGAKTTPIVLYPEEAGDIRADAVQISGDGTAADNLEAILDGTGGVVLKLAQLLIAATGNNSAIDVTGAGTGHGIKATGGASAGAGMKLAGGAGGEGLYAMGGSAGASGFLAQGGDPEGSGMALLGSLVIQAPGEDPAITLANVDETGDLITGNGDPIGGAGGGGNITEINGSATAAENARKAFSGEAYNAAGLSISTAANVTNMVSANITQVGSSVPRAQRLFYLLDGLTYSTAKTGTLTATAFTTNLTETTNDHYVGATIKFVSGALAGQLSFVSDYNGATKTITVSPALTEAPANNDVFILL